MEKYSADFSDYVALIAMGRMSGVKITMNKMNLFGWIYKNEIHYASIVYDSNVFEWQGIATENCPWKDYSLKDENHDQDN